ncbi:MAG: N-acetylmuramoyl-L-alanine amidase [Alphaproteobacteria bacterium]|nr:N-acetylmuramoyl-L-alanine amidase [Alphaproteobacteria bacterium]
MFGAMFIEPEIVDLTAISPKAYRLRSRSSARIDAVVLHQTGFSRGNTPTSYKDTKAHYVVMPNGTVVHLHPNMAYLAASSAFNEDSVSIEFVGNFPSDSGGYWQPGKMGKHRPTSDQVASGRWLVARLQKELGLSFVFAHRQGETANARGNCPGPDIWYQIGEWAKTHLRMDDGGEGYVEGNGAAIPKKWRGPLRF